MNKEAVILLGRRLDRANTVAKRLFNIYYDNFGDTFTPHMSEESKKRALGIFRKTRTPCSCWMCGNPRKRGGGKTRAERADADSIADQVGDYLCEGRIPLEMRERDFKKYLKTGRQGGSAATRGSVSGGSGFPMGVVARVLLSKD